MNRQRISTPVSGRYGHIYGYIWKNMPDKLKQGSQHPEDMPVAIKKPTNAPNSIKYLQNEIDILQQLEHPNIVKYLGRLRSQNSCWLIMERIMGGDLHTLLKEQPDSVSPLRQLSILLDIARAVNYLHCRQIIHRDIKPRNILIERQGEAIIAKLCDFGFAVPLVNTDELKRIKGTVHYMAPEILNSTMPHSEKSDIFSLAITMWMLASKRKPYESIRTREGLSEHLSTGYREEIPEDTFADFAELIIDCWDTIPNKRPLAEEIINRLTDMTFKRELYYLACNSMDLTETRKAELQSFLFRHPDYLTRDINGSGFTVLHYAFCENNQSLINELMNHPRWDNLAKTRTTHNYSLFDVIALNGYEQYYDLLKPAVEGPPALRKALRIAAVESDSGNTGFCRRLLADGAQFRPGGKTAERLAKLGLFASPEPAPVLTEVQDDEEIDAKGMANSVFGRSTRKRR